MLSLQFSPSTEDKRSGAGPHAGRPSLCGAQCRASPRPGRFLLSSLQPQARGQLLGKVPSAPPQPLRRRSLPCGRTCAPLAPVLLQARPPSRGRTPHLSLSPSPSGRPSFPLSVRLAAWTHAGTAGILPQGFRDAWVSIQGEDTCGLQNVTYLIPAGDGPGFV